MLAWQHFVDRYMSVDRRVLGVFRIGYGAVLLYDLARRAIVLDLFYSNAGVLSNHFVLFRPQDEFQLSLLDAFSTPEQVRVAFALIALVYAAYTLGLCTRLAQVLSLVCLTSLNSRNLFMEDGGVSMLILLGAWTVFLPLGERISLDGLRVEAGCATIGERVLWRKGSSTPAVSLAVLALSMQLLACYWLNAAHKTGATWRHGEAVHYVLWQRRIVTDFGFWLAHHEPRWFSPLATYGTVALEWALPVLALASRAVWTRVAAFAAAVLLHGGIAMTMTLGPFSYAMLALVLLRLPWPAFEACRRPIPLSWRKHWARRRAQCVALLRGARRHGLRSHSARISREPSYRPLREATLALMLLAALVDLSSHNVAFPFHITRAPSWLRAIVGYPRCLQRWSMFAPDAPTEDGAGVVDAWTTNGVHVDPFTGDAPNFAVLERGPLAHGDLGADYLFSLHFNGNRDYRHELTRHLHAWRGAHFERSEQIAGFDFWWLSSQSPAPGSTQPGPVRRELVFRDH